MSKFIETTDNCLVNVNSEAGEVMKNEFGDFGDLIEFENNNMELDLIPSDFDQCQEFNFNTEFADGRWVKIFLGGS